MLRRRLLLEWWAAVAVVTAAVLLASLLILPDPPGQAWSLALAGVILALLLAIGVGAVVAVRRVPVDPSPFLPGRFRERDATAAAVEVRRGRSVQPPELRAAAIDLARRGLRATLPGLAGLPLSGTALASTLVRNDHILAAGLLSATVLAIVLAGLGQVRRVQRRLDALEDAEAHTSTLDGAPTPRPTPCDAAAPPRPQDPT